MTTRDTHGASLEVLAHLTPLGPDPSRAEAVRLRCRSQLAPRLERARRIDAVVGPLERVFGPALLGAFSAWYAVALLITTLRLR
jgi:hypothetical protein